MIIFKHIIGPDGKPYLSMEDLEKWLEQEKRFGEANSINRDEANERYFHAVAQTAHRLLYTIRSIKI